MLSDKLRKRKRIISELYSMKKVVEPIIHGLDTEYVLDLADCKRPCGYGDIEFECPKCGKISTQDLSHGDPLEYGSFFGFDECNHCGTPFKHQSFEVIATVKVVKRNAEV